jgi:hypothetical protein
MQAELGRLTSAMSQVFRPTVTEHLDVFEPSEEFEITISDCGITGNRC